MSAVPVNVGPNNPLSDLIQVIGFPVLIPSKLGASQLHTSLRPTGHRTEQLLTSGQFDPSTKSRLVRPAVRPTADFQKRRDPGIG